MHRYTRIQDIEAAYLFANYTRLKTAAVLQQKIQDIVAGRIPHCAWLLSRIIAQSPECAAGRRENVTM